MSTGVGRWIMQELEVAVRTPAVTHATNLKWLRAWMATSSKSPKEAKQKYRVKETLSGLLASNDLTE